ncbi:MAG: GNAT family N-acetyltransferase [Alphaproteobacteria bacterium]|nr:GNAT family N-acetyltransferase [Alphaproteobacteria bacterium]
MPELVFPDKKYLPEVLAAIKEYQEEKSEFMIRAVEKMIAAAKDGFEQYFTEVKNQSLGIGLPQNHVAHTVFWLIEDEKYVGTFDLRHSLTLDLEKRGGHIAYQIRPSTQGKGFAFKGLKLCLEKAFSQGIEKALITCDERNISSYAVMHKAMLENGGNELSKEEGGQRRVWIYTKRRYGKIRPLAVAVIKKQDRLLVIPGYDEIKKEKFYRLPGGGIEFGETSFQALQREIKEEIGAEAVILKQLGIAENIFTFNGQQGHEIVIAYEATLPEEYMKKDKIPRIEKEFSECFYEFVKITPDMRVYPQIAENSGVF